MNERTADFTHDRTTRLLARVLFCAGLLAQPLVLCLFWNDGWDDGAITMAFARTFAHTGTIQGTPGSGIVEGYSTTLWMLVLAALARLFASPAALLAAAKTLTCLLNLANILLVRQVIRRWRYPLLADLTAGLLGLTGLTLFESLNAMEGPLMLALMLALALLLPLRSRRQTALFAVVGAGFVLARFEAIFLILPLLLLVRPLRRSLAVCASWWAAFAFEEIWRVHTFGAWIPNTILAKRHVPYITASRSGELFRHLHPFVTLRQTLTVPLLLLVLAILTAVVQRGGRLAKLPRRFNLHDMPRDMQIAAVIAGAGLLLDFAVGANWGPPDRELFSALPFVMYLLLRLAFGLIRDRNTARIVTLLLVALAGCKTARVFARMHQPGAPLYMPRITVANLASVTPAIERIREAAGLSTLTFATPDVGGVMLFGDNLHILDLGLLCDRHLATTGYADAYSYVFAQRKPEVIEVHGWWTVLTGFDHTPLLQQQYGILFLDRKRFFVRRDLLATMAASLETRTFLPDGRPQPEDDTDARSYATYEAPDLKINRAFATYAVFAPTPRARAALQMPAYQSYPSFVQ